MTAKERILNGITIDKDGNGGTLTMQLRARDILSFVRELNDLDRLPLLKTVFDYDTEDHLWLAIPAMINSLGKRDDLRSEALALTLLGIRINMCLSLLMHVYLSDIPEELLEDFLQGHDANYLEKEWLKDLRNTREAQTYAAAIEGENIKEIYSTTLNMN